MFEYFKTTKNKSKEKIFFSNKSIDISKTNSPKKYNIELNGNKEKLLINHLNFPIKKPKITLSNSKSNLNFFIKNTKTRSISPMNYNQVRNRHERNIKNKKSEMTMPNSVLDSPNSSYNKIILNLKTEFDEITRKTQSKDSKEKDNKTASLNNSNYFHHNSTKNILIINKKKEPRKITLNDFIFKPIKKRIQTSEKHNINNCSINNIFLGRNITFSRNLSLIKENNFSLLGKKKLNEEKNKKLEKELMEYKLAIALLKEYISTLIKVYSENSRKYNEEYVQLETLKKIKMLEEEVKELSKNNQKLKLACMKLLYIMEYNYFISLEREKKICKNVFELLTENIYLRELSKSVRIINNKNMINNNIFGINLNNTYKEYATQSFNKKIKSTNDIFNKILNSEIENTIKRDDRNKRDKSRIKNIINYNNELNNNKIIRKGPSYKQRKIVYMKKVNI